MKTPCVQSIDSSTSGIVVARRPPKMIAEIGTPRGSSACGDSAGLLRIGVVKRLLGCAALSPESFFHGRPCQSSRPSGGGTSIPSHHTSPSGVIATLVKMESCSNHLHRVQIRFRAGAGRDAEVSVLGIDRPQAAVGTDAHPRDVVADGRNFPSLELGRRRQHREIGLAACARKRGGDVSGLAVGTLQAEDQHVLGEPSFVAAEQARDSQRETFLAEQRVAAVTAADRDNRVVLRKVANQAPLGIQIERAMNSAIEVVGVRRVARARRAPIRVMIRMLSTT